MDAYNGLILVLFVYGIIFGAWRIVKKNGGFLDVVGLAMIACFLFAVAWGLPRFIKHDRAQQAKERKYQEERKKVELRTNHLEWAPKRFTLKVGKEPTVERIQTALAEVREELREKGIGGSERQWRNFVEANIPVKWDGNQWVRDEARWYQQWKN